jgi:uncharacterized membrane protein
VPYGPLIPFLRGTINLRKKTTMKTERITYVLIASLLANTVWLIASVRSSVSFDALIASVAVLALLAVAALDYRIDFKRLLGFGR